MSGIPNYWPQGVRGIITHDPIYESMLALGDVGIIGKPVTEDMLSDTADLATFHKYAPWQQFIWDEDPDSYGCWPVKFLRPIEDPDAEKELEKDKELEDA